jgi:hypothetical protein
MYCLFITNSQESISCGDAEGMLGSGGFFQCGSCLEKEKKQADYKKRAQDQLPEDDKIPVYVGDYEVVGTMATYRSVTYFGKSKTDERVVIIFDDAKPEVQQTTFKFSNQLFSAKKFKTLTTKI